MAKKHEDIELEIEETLEEPLRDDIEEQEAAVETEEQEEAGCFAIVLEKIPAQLTKQVCEQLTIPVIGIGAGPADGQVLVLPDMLGMNEGFHPKFLRQYAHIGQEITEAVARYAEDVLSADSFSSLLLREQ